DAHLSEYAPEVRTAVLDAHRRDDVRLGLAHVPYQHGHGLRRGTPGMLVSTVSDDECHRAHGHTVVGELLRFGEDGPEEHHGLVIERGAERRVVVVLVQTYSLHNGTVWKEHVAIQEPRMRQNTVALVRML